jgi:hypothetical protein
MISSCVAEKEAKPAESSVMTSMSGCGAVQTALDDAGKTLFLVIRLHRIRLH